MASDKIREPHLAQVGLCTNNMPATVRLFREVFGFADCGGDLTYGPLLAKAQGLGDDASCICWWMVGREDFTQIELFTHTLPAQRPLDPSWRPSDLGWVRWGIAVPEFDAAQARLEKFGIDPIAPPIKVDGLKRLCFREPWANVIIEVLEEGESLPFGIRPTFYDLTPAVAYAALSVQDLDLARDFFAGTLGLTEVDAVLHPPECDATWGLPGAKRESILFSADGLILEVNRYDDPIPRRFDRLVSDQGMMNAAFGTRDRAEIGAIEKRVRDAGYAINTPLWDLPSVATYVDDGQGNSVELLCINREDNRVLGQEPRPLYGGPPAWPQRI